MVETNGQLVAAYRFGRNGLDGIARHRWSRNKLQKVDCRRIHTGERDLVVRKNTRVGSAIRIGGSAIQAASHPGRLFKTLHVGEGSAKRLPRPEKSEKAWVALGRCCAVGTVTTGEGMPCRMRRPHRTQRRKFGPF